MGGYDNDELLLLLDDDLFWVGDSNYAVGTVRTKSS